MVFGRASQNVKIGFYVVFRLLVGFAFLLHGGQKLFGWFGGIQGSSVKLFSLMGLAGVIEFFGGLLIFLGLFTSIAASIAAVEMLVAYFMAHFPNGILPIQNGGDPPWLFFAAFLVLAVYGAKALSLEKLLFGKEFMVSK